VRDELDDRVASSTSVGVSGRIRSASRPPDCDTTSRRRHRGTPYPAPDRATRRGTNERAQTDCRWLPITAARGG